VERENRVEPKRENRIEHRGKSSERDGKSEVRSRKSEYGKEEIGKSPG